MIPQEMEWAIEIAFVTKGNWMILFLKKGEESVPVVESGWYEEVLGSTFMCLGVISDDAGNDGRVCKAARNPKRVAPRKLKAGR